MKTLAALCLVPLLISQTFAFNLETHAFITREARDRSVLNKDNTDLAQRYGFDRLEPKHIFDNQNSFRCLATSPNSVAHRDAYIDARGTWLNAPGSNPRANVFGRCLTLFEQLSMPPDYTGLLPNPNADVGPTGWLRLEGWLMRGAIREDDFESGAYDNPNLFPDQDPWVDEFRSVHHFYNPISDGTYFGALSVNGTRSTTWALGIADDTNWENVQLPDVARGNHFSYADARKLMFLALTYKRDLIVNYRDESQLRMNMWATMFKSLGHIVHLLQDTASPQHVRGEGHSRLCNGTRRQDFPEQPEATRTFENFTNYRVTVPFDAELDRAGLKNTYSFANLCDDYKWRDMFKAAGQAIPTDTIPWTGTGNTYPIPQFSVQRKFFTTRTEDAAINSRRGLADYVNRGFFTEGAFLRSDGAPDPNFPSPPPLANIAYTPGTSSTDFIPGLGNIENQTLYWAVPDAIAPNYPDRGLINAKAPIVARSLWTSVVADGPGSMEIQSFRWQFDVEKLCANRRYDGATRSCLYGWVL